MLLPLQLDGLVVCDATLTVAVSDGLDSNNDHQVTANLDTHTATVTAPGGGEVTVPDLTVDAQERDALRVFIKPSPWEAWAEVLVTAARLAELNGPNGAALLGELLTDDLSGRAGFATIRWVLDFTQGVSSRVAVGDNSLMALAMLTIERAVVHAPAEAAETLGGWRCCEPERQVLLAAADGPPGSRMDRALKRAVEVGVVMEGSKW